MTEHHVSRDSQDDDGSDAALPHDRDETPVAPKNDAQHRANRGPIEQARNDVEAGIQDTERIGTPTDLPSGNDNGSAKR